MRPNESMPDRPRPLHSRKKSFTAISIPKKDETIMAINTVIDLINQSVRLLNINAVGDTLPAAEAEEALDILNMMLGQWQNDGLNIYYEATGLYDMTANDNVYTIGKGAGADFDAVRPLKILHAFTRLSTGTNLIDYPMEEITTAQYQNFPNKTITTQYPNYFLYQPTWPNATITLFPISTMTLKLGLTMQAQLGTFTTYNDALSLPPGYLQALRYNLAVNLAPQYGRVGSSGFVLIEQKARESLAAIESTNTTPVFLGMDEMVTPRGRYSIYSDM